LKDLSLGASKSVFVRKRSHEHLLPETASVQAQKKQRKTISVPEKENIQA